MKSERRKMLAGGLYDPVDPELVAGLRRRQEFGRPVEIGSRAVIGAGSVVTRDVPEGVLAAENPCHVITEPGVEG